MTRRCPNPWPKAQLHCSRELCPDLFPTLKAWARNLHAAGVPSLVTIAPVPDLLDDGSGTGRSAVDVWTMLPWTYDHTQTYDPPLVTQVLAKGLRRYPGEGLLVYPGKRIGISGVAPSMRLKYLRDGVDDFDYIQILKSCGQGDAALALVRTVGADWSHWTTDESALEAVRRQLGDLIQAMHCTP